jgi:hypothetical protein
MPGGGAEQVAFDVLLRAPASGRTPHVATIDQFRPDPENIEKCRRWLAGEGVTCYATDFGLACSAPCELFESLFGVSLKPVRPASPGRPPFEIVGEIRSPAEVADMIDQVSISAPPEFF